MAVILFEDGLWRHFGPVAYTRPLFDLRCGAFTLRERVVEKLYHYQHGPQLDSQALIPDTTVAAGETVFGICRPHLMGSYGLQGGIRLLLQDGKPLTLINGRALDLDWLPRLLAAPLNTVYEAQGVLLGARLTPALSSAILYYLREQEAVDALEELRRFVHVEEIEATLLDYPWDMITHGGEQLVRDLPLLRPHIPPYRHTDAQVTVRGGEHIFVHPSAQLDGPMVLDARDGPIFVDKEARIEPFSFIQGPAYIGPGSLIASARIRGETSIGPVCRIGGEVEASIIQGFSNKHHEGFLGHSWLGEWVNVGAMTTNSDLKNTYGTVRVIIEGLGQLNSGVLKLGCFLADHVKLSIGLHLNGGTVIGTASSIFGVHVAPKTVPAFTWGGEVFHEYRIDNMIDVARKVMSRRKQIMSPEYETMLREIFAMTSTSRGTLTVQPARLPTKRRSAGEQALARVETEAIRSFETA